MSSTPGFDALFADFGAGPADSAATGRSAHDVAPLDSLWLTTDDPSAPAVLGGKAASLLRLHAAGCATPAGFVVTHNLFAALTAHADASNADALAAAISATPFPDGFEPALARRLQHLGGTQFSVRSSFAHEDRAGEVAAGLYESVIGVPAAEVPTAIRRVLVSAVGAGATAYAAAHGFANTAPPLAVLIHPYLAGIAHGGAACAGPLPVIVDVHAGTLSPTGRAAIEDTTRALCAQHGPLEIEWVDRGDDVVYLQLRPFQPASPPVPWAGFAELPAGLRDLPWTWDAAHNPLPLSAAHAGLVDWVDRECRIGIRQRRLGGYLCWAPDPRGRPHQTTPATLRARFDAIAAQAEVDLHGLGLEPRLNDALAVFTRHYQPLLGELPPAAAAARKALASFVAQQIPAAAQDSTLAALLAEVESKQAERRRRVEAIAASPWDNDESRAAAVADYLEIFGDEALAWDLASPTAREQPDRFFPGTSTTNTRAISPGPARDPVATLAQLSQRLPTDERAVFASLVDQARDAVAVSEDDDWLYARLQAPVRHAIRALARRHFGKGLTSESDAFDLSLVTLLALERGESLSPQRIADEVAANRAAHTAARHAPPPLAAARASAPATSVLRGHGTGGRAIGRIVHRHGEHGHAPPADAILLATTLLPTELPLLTVAALITETGGPLGHVATLARESGLPAIVGVVGAVARLSEGQLVMVDADAGVIVPC